MKTITVNASKTYNVTIGSDLLPLSGKVIRAVTKASKAVIISDSNVYPLYGNTVLESVKANGFQDVFSFVFSAGEESKNGNNYLAILEFLAERHITRSDCLIALGGGVVGDITGFVAATYLRGIDYVQIPTTVLAAVDSSVGGKTAIDLSAGKNLVGAFYQPNAVICDLNTFTSLPIDVFRDGCAEIIKYGILYDQSLFDHLNEHGIDFDRETVIARCVELKRDVVAHDEFDRGQRQKLNLGHTIGHGIEASSNFTISHGSAVAIGMAIISRAAAKLGLCSQETKDRIIGAIKKFSLPVTTNETAKTLFTYALSDKKREGSTVNLIIPNRIGQCAIYPTHTDDIESLIQAGL